ncbi:hypothetical protein BDN72DRAFT_902818 [Pluteus cervinus]|uniref:Uncharacterized protein n=1 Tax=Pluteus cervinus TaxID=181527 RepID=A0ACD3AB16_9AGAR|nr:hypothetical protein BDN72DRAFT_902818 [Pluteus cervinus]
MPFPNGKLTQPSSSSSGAGHQHCRMRQKAIAFSNLFRKAIGLPRIPTDAAMPHHPQRTPGPTLIKIDLETHNIISTTSHFPRLPPHIFSTRRQSPFYHPSHSPTCALGPPSRFLSFDQRRLKEEQRVNYEVEFMRILPGAEPAEVNFVQPPTYTDEKAALRGCESFLGCLVGGTERNGIAYVSGCEEKARD